MINHAGYTEIEADYEYCDQTRFWRPLLIFKRNGLTRTVSHIGRGQYVDAGLAVGRAERAARLFMYLRARASVAGCPEVVREIAAHVMFSEDPEKLIGIGRVITCIRVRKRLGREASLTEILSACAVDAAGSDE